MEHRPFEEGEKWREYEHNGVKAIIARNSMHGLYHKPWVLIAIYPGNNQLSWEHGTSAKAFKHMQELFEQRDNAQEWFEQFKLANGIA